MNQSALETLAAGSPAGRLVRGPIDWSANFAHRAASGGDRTQYIVRPARRIFDTLENRVLAWLLRRLAAALGEIPRAETLDEPDPAELGWFLELDEARRQLHRARQTPRHADVLMRRTLLVLLAGVTMGTGLGWAIFEWHPWANGPTTDDAQIALIKYVGTSGATCTRRQYPTTMFDCSTEGRPGECYQHSYTVDISSGTWDVTSLKPTTRQILTLDDC